MNKCRCCSKDLSSQIFSAKVLNRNVEYFDCINCGYVQTQEPLWLEEDYESAIDNKDTLICMRKESNG